MKLKNVRAKLGNIRLKNAKLEKVRIKLSK